MALYSDIHVTEPRIISEFYHLRRTAIKDLAAYVGFLAGFVGAAPFAWSLLSDQLASGSFVRGLWYFFGIVIAAGFFAGTAGLGLGHAGGILWEQLHRQRRRSKVRTKTSSEDPRRNEPAAIPSPITPRLKLVSIESADLPIIDGRVMRSVQFRSQSIELDFGGIRLSLIGNPVTVCKGQRFRYPDPGARDALCSLIGDRVQSVRVSSADRVDVVFDSGCELVMLRNSVAVA